MVRGWPALTCGRGLRPTQWPSGTISATLGPGPPQGVRVLTFLAVHLLKCVLCPHARAQTQTTPRTAISTGVGPSARGGMLRSLEDEFDNSPLQDIDVARRARVKATLLELKRPRVEVIGHTPSWMRSLAIRLRLWHGAWCATCQGKNRSLRCGGAGIRAMGIGMRRELLRCVDGWLTGSATEQPLEWSSVRVVFIPKDTCA